MNRISADSRKFRTINFAGVHKERARADAREEGGWANEMKRRIENASDARVFNFEKREL